MEIDDDLCATLASLASDNIVGVRIGLARLIGFICGMTFHTRFALIAHGTIFRSIGETGSAHSQITAGRGSCSLARQLE